jgi:DNA polymerase III alpha subunit (gram-positive type)
MTDTSVINMLRVRGEVKSVEEFWSKNGRSLSKIRIDLDLTKFGQNFAILTIDGELAKHARIGAIVEIKGKLGGKEHNGKVFGDAKVTDIVEIQPPLKAHPNDDDVLPF